MNFQLVKSTRALSQIQKQKLYACHVIRANILENFLYDGRILLNIVRA